jgi:hypothetical protein
MKKILKKNGHNLFKVLFLHFPGLRKIVTNLRTASEQAGIRTKGQERYCYENPLSKTLFLYVF